MSCENAAKTGGSCPTTRFEKMRFKLTDKEQCNFARSCFGTLKMTCLKIVRTQLH